MQYITNVDFHKSKEYKKINKHIDICLTLIEKLIIYNSDCKQLVQHKLNIEDHIIDYRLNQFGYYENTLKSIYYSCYSLKNIYETSTYMTFKGIKNTIGYTLDNQKSYITFTALVKMSSIFEFTRKIYEKNITGTPYFNQMRIKYPTKVDSLELLNNFRNTIHSNANWEPRNGLDNLNYSLREGEQIIKPGEVFKYDHWKLYTIIKDCLELNMLMALDNDALRIRHTTLKVNGQNVVIVKTEMTPKDWDDVFQKNSIQYPDNNI